SRLKLRASWGKLGNDKIPYDRRYAVTDQNILSIFGNPGSSNPGISYGLSGNPDLRWEVTTQTDIGLEGGFFNDRLTAEFDFYNKQTDDILIELSTPGYFGNGQGGKITFNAASVLNRGIELTLSWRDKIGKLKYNIGANGTTIHNEVLKVGGSSGVDSVLFGGSLGNGQSVTRSAVGIPIGSFYGYRTAGIFQNQAELDAYPHLGEALPGDLRFEDVNKDGIIDSRDRVNLGSPIPTFVYGFNAGIEIFGIDFSVNIQGQTGNKIFNAKEMIRPDKYNFEHHVLDGWTTEGSSTTEPKPSFGGNNYLPSDKFIQDGSYLRIRSVILGYSLPGSWMKKVFIQKFRIYLKAENLYTFTKFTGYTPEIGGPNLSSGIDFGAYPITAVYSAGINLTF
ncbi:MAG TPA: TonB-dependent receptor, partial [Bacteroidales bacterium]|nr:TonB-dependent receptor [Bacteroidales bacterium]